MTVFDEVSENRKLIMNIEKRRVKFIVHLLKRNEFVTHIMEGKVLGKRGRGRQNNPYILDINYRMLIANYCDIKGAALDRKEWLPLQDITLFD